MFPLATEAGVPRDSVFYSVVNILRTKDGKSPDTVVVEVTRKQEGHWIVVMAVQSGGDPSRVEAVIAFSDSSVRCGQLSQDGLPAFEAAITARDDGLHVEVHAFARAQPGGPPGDGGATLTRFIVGGLPLLQPVPPPEQNVSTAHYVSLYFHQRVVAPDPIDPAATVRVLADGGVRLSGEFRGDEEPPTVTLDIPELRYPNLRPLSSAEQRQASRVLRGQWSGVMSERPQANQPNGLPPSTRRSRDELQYVPASFRFESVDWLGFRIDLQDSCGDPRAVADLLAELTAPLKPLDQGYEAAGTTLTLDLLRYGRMHIAERFGELTPNDWFSQHELALRIAVRRPGEARSASFVAAIWVDNPWSRYLGRELQGFDKRLAAARDGRGRRLDDRGRIDGVEVPLWQVAAVNAVDREPEAPPVLALGYGVDPAAAPLLDIATTRLVDGPGTLAGLLDEEGLAIAGSRPWTRGEFNNVQVSPCDARPLPRALIESRFNFSKLRVGFPDGLARLSLGTYGFRTPPAWQGLCDFLDRHGGRELTLPAGDWYRISCDLRMEVVDPLGW